MRPQRAPAQTAPPVTGGRLETSDSPTKWECQLAQVEGGPTLPEFTVGTKFLLQCQGPSVGEWKSQMQLKFPQAEQQYTLALLTTQKLGPNHGEWIVTGYKPGEHKPEWVEITDGVQRVRVEGLEWNINTVVKAESGQPPQPFPPYGPVSLIWPWWLWVSALGLILIVAALVFWRVRRHRARKALLERLKAKGTALTPYLEFHKNLRHLARRYAREPREYVSQLDQGFRLYLTREFLVPADEWTDRAVLADIRRRHRPIYRDASVDLSSLLRELKRARQSEKLSVEDCEQLHEISRQLVEKIHSHKEALT